MLKESSHLYSLRIRKNFLEKVAFELKPERCIQFSQLKIMEKGSSVMVGKNRWK